MLCFPPSHTQWWEYKQWLSLNEEFATTWDGWEVEKTAVSLSMVR